MMEEAKQKPGCRPPDDDIVFSPYSIQLPLNIRNWALSVGPNKIREILAGAWMLDQGLPTEPVDLEKSQKQTSNRWTSEADAFLKLHYPENGAIWCAEKLQRKINAVSQRAHLLGIHFLRVPNKKHDIEGIKSLLSRNGSFINDELWESLLPLLPPLPPLRKSGFQSLDDRAVLNGILFVLSTGIAWDGLPTELGFGSGPTCRRRLRYWQARGAWGRLQQMMLIKLPQSNQFDWGRVHVE